MASRPSHYRISIEHSGGKYWVYDHAFNEVKAGPFETLSDAKAAYAVIKSRARYTTSSRYHATLGFKTKYPGGQKKHNPQQYIKTGSEHLLVTSVAMDSWSGKPKYYAGGNWWYFDRISGKLKRENYQGQKQRRYGKLVETNLAEIRAGKSNVGTGKAVQIYGRCLRIEAVKTRGHEYGGKSTASGQKYYHDFTTKNAKIYGLPNGDLLISTR